MKTKPLYKITLNWSGEIHTFYTHSYSPHLALSNAARQLAKKLSLNPTVCRAKFTGQKDNFKIEKEK